MLPNWSMILHTLSTWPQLSSLRVFMYDMRTTVDDKSCQMIAEAAPLFTDFGFCFRRKHSSWYGIDIDSVFNGHTKFIKQLCHCILRLSLVKQPYYSIEEDGCGLTMWF